MFMFYFFDDTPITRGASSKEKQIWEYEHYIDYVPEVGKEFVSLIERDNKLVPGIKMRCDKIGTNYIFASAQYREGIPRFAYRVCPTKDVKLPQKQKEKTEMEKWAEYYGKKYRELEKEWEELKGDIERLKRKLQEIEEKYYPTTKESESGASKD